MKNCDNDHSAAGQLIVDYKPAKEAAMRYALSIFVIVGLLLATAVDVIAAGARMSAHRNNYATRLNGITVAVPSGIKLAPELLPQ